MDLTYLEKIHLKCSNGTHRAKIFRLNQGPAMCDRAKTPKTKKYPDNNKLMYSLSKILKNK